jgi:hypothetical protein
MTELEQLEESFKNIARAIPDDMEFIAGLVDIILSRNPYLKGEKWHT